jgi:hypothetical protein
LTTKLGKLGQYEVETLIAATAGSIATRALSPSFVSLTIFPCEPISPDEKALHLGKEWPACPAPMIIASKLQLMAPISSCERLIRFGQDAAS